MEEPEKLCKNCGNWRPNGGVLGMGYCIPNQWGYRKPTQGCKDKFEPKETMKVKVTCRYGVEYEVEFTGTRGAVQRSVNLMGRCCCWVCHNKACDQPRNEALKDCGNVCEMWTKKHYCDTALLQRKQAK